MVAAYWYSVCTRLMGKTWSADGVNPNEHVRTAPFTTWLGIPNLQRPEQQARYGKSGCHDNRNSPPGKAVENCGARSARRSTRTPGRGDPWDFEADRTLGPWIASVGQELCAAA